MHDTEMHEVSDEFAPCWQVAGRHLQSQVQGPLRHLAAREPDIDPVDQHA